MPSVAVLLVRGDAGHNEQLTLHSPSSLLSRTLSSSFPEVCLLSDLSVIFGTAWNTMSFLESYGHFISFLTSLSDLSVNNSNLELVIQVVSKFFVCFTLVILDNLYT